MRATLPLILSLLLGTSASAQRPCLCSDPGAEVPTEADTVFRIVPRFDAGLCGRIDRSVTPYLYRDFTLRSCITVADRPLREQGPTHACHIAVSGGMLVVDELQALPTGPDLTLVDRPCWRTNYVLRLHEDTAQYAVNAMPELIADLPHVTPDQRTRVQAHWDALKPAIYWTDQELLAKVFLLAVQDGEWYQRFSELRTSHRFGGTMAMYYDELQRILNEKRAGRPQ